MDRLSLYLPSFAADYSGACSCLFDLDFLVVLNDAACCTRNYIDYDEPRWSRAKATTLCARLRTMDVVMGDEAKTVAKVATAARRLRPHGIALLGSPVPAITGMDVSGMACEVEAETGIPAIGLSTTGFSTYERGIDCALRGLLQRFCDGSGGGSDPGVENPLSVSPLGMTPLDFGAEGNAEDLATCLADAGFSVGSSWCMGLTFDAMARTACSSVNLVVSAGATGAAEDMWRRFGIPYVVGLPCAGRQADLVFSSLRRAVEVGRPVYAFAESREASSGVRGSGDRMLIVGDWVCDLSLRSAFRLSGWNGSIDVASFFGARPHFAEEGDATLSGEGALVEMMARGAYDIVLGDPLLERIPQVGNARLVRLAHPAVSSSLFREEVPRYFVDDMTRVV